MPLPWTPPQETGAALRHGLSATAVGWLRDQAGDPGPGVSLLAVGSLARSELSVLSDLDVLVLHENRAAERAEQVARGVLAAARSAGVETDHAVRTGAESLQLAVEDLPVALGLLTALHVAGDADLSAGLVSSAREQWRRRAPDAVQALARAAEDRERRAGELAFLVEPDLRESRGGLRDGLAVQALAAAWLCDGLDERRRAAYELLLDVRGEAHRLLASRGQQRREDRLLLGLQPAVAGALGLGDEDELLAAVSGAGRSLSRAADAALRSGRALTVRTRRPLRGRPAARRPLADGVVAQEGEVVLSRDADPAADPGLVLRAASAAAGAGLPLSPHALARLAAGAPGLAEPWPAETREEFLRLLSAGRPAIGVVEDLDEAGLWEPLMPEWRAVRHRPQRNPFHSYTVDRHLLETVARAAELVRATVRPDLLLYGALLHDIGKGGPQDHSVRGAELARDFAARAGLGPSDAEVLHDLVRHHLLLAEVATSRDLADPATAERVAATLGSPLTLDVLHQLCVADGRATGPTAWSEWKAQLVAELVGKVAHQLTGAPGTPGDSPLAHTDWLDRNSDQCLLENTGTGLRLALSAPDGPGLLAAAAGVAALHGLQVRSARSTGRGSRALLELDVQPRFGRSVDAARLHEEFRASVAGSFPLADRLAARAGDYPAPVPAAPPEVTWVEGASRDSAVLQVRAGDRPGLLYAVAAAIGACGVSVRSAHCTTVGAEVIDTFYLPMETRDTGVAATVLQALA